MKPYRIRGVNPGLIFDINAVGGSVTQTPKRVGILAEGSSPSRTGVRANCCGIKPYVKQVRTVRYRADINWSQTDMHRMRKRTAYAPVLVAMFSVKWALGPK